AAATWDSRHGAAVRLRAGRGEGPRRGRPRHLPELPQQRLPAPPPEQEGGASVLRARRAVWHRRVPAVPDLQSRAPAEGWAAGRRRRDAGGDSLVPRRTDDARGLPGPDRELLASARRRSER